MANPKKQPQRVPGSCGVINDPVRKHFSEMWHLVKQASLRIPFWRPVWNIFTDELMIAIFWEESTFRNRPQQDSKCREVGPAFGFGQIEPGGFNPYKALTKNKPPHPQLEYVIQDDDWSVELSMRLLHYLYDENPGKHDKLAALKSYGSVFQFPKRIATINNWLACEAELRRGERTFKNPDGYWLPPRSQIETALLAAKHDSGAFIPEVLDGIP